MTTATEPVTIEGVDLDAEVPCESPHEGKTCPHDNPAELLTRTHITGRRVFFCRPCWTSFLGGFCIDNDRWETRDDHFRIIEVLR